MNKTLSICIAAAAMLGLLGGESRGQTLIDDVASTCAALERDAESRAGKQRLDMFEQIFACRVRNYWKPKDMADPVKRTRKILQRRPAMSAPGTLLGLEGKFTLGELDKLVVAQSYAGITVSAKELERKLGEAVAFYTLHRAIDRAALRREIEQATFVVGKAKDLLIEFCVTQGQIADAWDAVRKQQPATDALFALAGSRYAQWQRDRAKRGAYGALLDTLTQRLLNGERPTVAECEQPVMAAYERHLDLGLAHPMSSLAVHVMATCAHARGDGEFAASFDGWLPRGVRAVGPLGAIADVLNDQLLKAGDATAARLRPAASITAATAPFRAPSDASGATLMPREGPMKVSSTTPVTYDGLDYVLVEGKGMSVRVPVMRCVSTQMGWEVGNGKMTPRMGSACTFTGKFRNENIASYTQLVPRVFAKSIAVGKWYRFRSLSRNSELHVDPAKVRPATKASAHFGVPILRADTLETFTAVEANMGLSRGELGPLVD